MINLTRVYFGDKDKDSDGGEGAGNDQQVYVLIWKSQTIKQ